MGLFWREEGGTITLFALFFLVALALVGGLALDVMNRTAKITRLHMTTDSVAHAAMHARRTMSEADAIALALVVAHQNMPIEQYGTVFLAQDIQFGTWSSTGNTFVPQSGSRSSVRVTPRMTVSRGSAVPTYLLRLSNGNAWELASETIFSQTSDPCLSNAFVARTEIRFNSNNHFEEGLCLHSNGSIWLRQNNTFEDGKIVSLPDLNNLDVPGGSMAGNPGLSKAVKQNTIDLAFIDDLPQTIAALTDSQSDKIPSYITSPVVLELSAQDVDASSFYSGYIPHVTCAQNGGTLVIPNNLVLRNIVLVTNCSLRFGNGAAVEESIVATTSTAAQSIRGSSGARFGSNQGCEAGVGTQIITLGGMFFPAKLTVNGAQMIAAGTINFQANASMSGSGASMIADVIDGRTNMNVGSCDAPMENNMGRGRIRPVRGN